MVGLQYFGTRQNDAQFASNPGSRGNRGPQTVDRINTASNFAVYAEEQFDLTQAVALVAGARGQYAVRGVRDRFGTNDADVVDFWSLSPKVGAIWRIGPQAQVYANASHAYEPPFLLELTAPGQIAGTLGDLQAQKAWQFEVGTRGTWGPRLAWDVAVYDIELWDEIQNVNVAPFPGAGFTIPRFRNVDRSRHTGVEVGGDVLLVENLAQRRGRGATGDRVRARAAYTWSRFVFVDDRNLGNNDLPGAPRHFVRAELRYDHASGAWLAPGIEVVPQGYFVTSENDARTQAYTLLNVRAGYDYQPWKLGVFFEARNLTDATYASSVVVDAANKRFFEPGDGRAFYGGLEWRWQ
jgi:iron complex outermembrane receptor protein